MFDKATIASIAKGVWKRAGYKGFFKGCFINLFGITPFIGLKLSLFDYLNSFWGVARDHKLFDIINITNGALATIVAGSCTYPSELLKRVWQLRGIDETVPNYTNLRVCCKDIYSKQGLKGFFNGMLAANMKVVPANALLFLFNERIKKWWGVQSK